MQKTAIIIPCYNEALRLNPSLFFEYLKENENVHFIFVNDGSSDETRDILEDACQGNRNRMMCIHLPQNRGKAEAIRQGFLKTWNMDFDYIGYWDADLATPLDHINKFLNILTSSPCKLVMGARVQLLGRKIERNPMRHYTGRACATFISMALQLPVYDTQCGSKIFKNDAVLKQVFSNPFTTGWIFDVEILARYKIIGNRMGQDCIKDSVVEYPLYEWSDIPGSKVKLWDYIIGGLDLIKILILLRKNS